MGFTGWGFSCNAWLLGCIPIKPHVTTSPICFLVLKYDRKLHTFYPYFFCDLQRSILFRLKTVFCNNIFCIFKYLACQNNASFQKYVFYDKRKKFNKEKFKCYILNLVSIYIDISMGTTRRHKQFLKIFNITLIWHKYNTPNEVSVLSNA